MKGLDFSTKFGSIDESVEALQKRDNLHVTRKLWHMSSGLFAVYLYKTSGVTKFECAWFVFYLAVASIVLDLLRLKIPAINYGFIKIWSPFMRQSEVKGFSGFPFYALGAAFSLYFYEEKIALLSIFFLIFADPISSFFGIKFGRTQIRKNKSLQGCIAGFLTCYVVSVLYCFYHLRQSFDVIFFSFLAAIVGSISEMIDLKIDDNFTIPVLSGFGLTMINVVFQIF